jgi:hypothetical protein
MCLIVFGKIASFERDPKLGCRNKSRSRLQSLVHICEIDVDRLVDQPDPRNANRNLNTISKLTR